MRFILSILLISINIQLQAQSSIKSVFDQNFTSEQLVEDFILLQQGLQKIHPALYRYTSKNAMDSIFNQMKKEIDTDMIYSEFYRILCTTIAKIKCQHTVAFPEEETLSQIRSNEKLFPLKLFWEFDPLRAYTTFDFSSEANLMPGTRIININGQLVEEIYKFLIPHFPSDGYILTNKQSRLQFALDFQLWYFLLIDRPDIFNVEMEDADGKVYKKTYSAVNFKEIKKNYKKFLSQKDPGLIDYTRKIRNNEKKSRSKPIRHEFLLNDIALLTIGNFDAPLFKKYISQAFTSFKKKNIKSLIVDVRNNQGGSDIFGRYLFNHLNSKPTVYFDSLYTSTGISDTAFLFSYTDKDAEWLKKNQQLVYSLPDGRYATKPEVNRGLLVQQPAENNFGGDVYILINGRSASTTAEFTSISHFNKLATFIGEESGGAYHGGNGGDFAILKLPNSKIQVQIPLSKYVMNSKESKYVGEGTLPDFPVNTTMKDILELKDPQLEFTLELIQKNKND